MFFKQLNLLKQIVTREVSPLQKYIIYVKNSLDGRLDGFSR